MDFTGDSSLKMLSELVESVNKLKRPPEQEATRGPTPLDKISKIEDLIIDSETKFFELQDTVQNKAHYWFLLGRLYNCSAKYRVKGLEALCKAVKLDNDCQEAWNELGECYWYTCNVDMARQCFERALEKGENKTSVRNLSIVMRKQALSLDLESRKENLNKASCLAKRAVELDPTDGVSWSILGNAFLAEFFSGSQNHQCAVQAIRAYKQAEKTLPPEENYELYYNKGIALKYTEQFAEALESLSLSAQYEASWPLPSNTYEQLLRYLDTVVLNLGKRGKLKAKKYWSMVKELKHPSLGPYKDDKSFTIAEFKDLQVGFNTNKLLHGKVLWSVQLDFSFPFTVGLVDVNGDEIVVTIFNLSAYKGFLVGDTIVIPNPIYTLVDVRHLDKVFLYL